MISLSWWVLSFTFFCNSGNLYQFTLNSSFFFRLWKLLIFCLSLPQKDSIKGWDFWELVSGRQWMGATNFQIVFKIYSERIFVDNYRTVRNYSEICGWFQKDRRFLLYPVPPWIIPPYSVFLYQLLSSKNISLSIVPFSQYNSTLYQLLCPAKTFVFFWGGELLFLPI